MGPPAAGSVGDPDEYEEMTVEEILTGKGDYFPGLITLVRARARARLRARVRAERGEAPCALWPGDASGPAADR